MSPTRACSAIVVAFTVASCGKAAEAPPAPVVIAPIASLPATSTPPAAAPGEHLVAADVAAALNLRRPVAPTGYLLAARVELDEKHRAPENLDQVVIVADHVPAGVTIGDTGHFKVESMPNVVFAGKITWIAPGGTQLRVAMQNMDHRLRLQMAGELTIDHDGAPGLAVPRSAITPGGAVLVAQGHTPDGRARFVEKPVTIAFDGGASWVTVTGLTTGVEIVGDVRQVP